MSPRAQRITSAKEVLFSAAFVCKIHSTSLTKFDGKMARGPRKNPLDFGGNLDKRLR